MHALIIATTQFGDKTSIMLSIQNHDIQLIKELTYKQLLLLPQSNTQNH